LKKLIDERVATELRYVYAFHYYGHLMTRQERLAYRNLILTAKTMGGRTDVDAQIEARKLQPSARLEAFKLPDDPKARRLVSEVSEAFKLSDDPEAWRLASEGLWAFEMRTAQRILADHSDKVAFNNCPQCGVVARTPKARQCRFCGFDWHTTSLCNSPATSGLGH
jgi:hypothetical protein